MKRLTNLILLLAISGVIFTSCSGKADIPVPVDAGLVIHIDGASLDSKLSWDEIRQSEWFQMGYKEAKDTLAKKIMDNPEESGVNIKSDFYMFMKAHGKGGYFAVTGKISNDQKFADFVTKTKDGEKITVEDGISISSSEDATLTWNKSRFIFLVNAPFTGAMYGNDFGSQDYNISSDSLVEIAKDLYDLKGKNSLGKDDKFASMLKEKGDAHFWMDAGHLYGANLPPMLSLTKANLLFNGNISAMTINFDNGKITMNSKNYYNDELEDLYEKHPMKDIDASMLKSIPPGNVAAVLAFNYPPQGLKDFLTVMGVDGFLNVFLAEAGITIEDFIKANKGDVILSVSDFSFGNRAATDTSRMDNAYMPQMPNAKILFATSVNDKPSFQKLIDVLTTKMGEAGAETGGNWMSKIPYQLKDNWFVAGSDSATVNSFGASNTDHPFISRISGHPFGGYLDIRQFINGSRPAMGKDSLAVLLADHSLKVWEDALFYGGEFKDDAMEMYGEVNFVDKNTNSLKQLNNYLGFIAIQEKKKMDSWRGIDSIRIEKIDSVR
jgi:hypothetical protein